MLHGRQFSPLSNRALVGLGQALLSVISAFAAYLLARRLALQDGFWASITAIAVTQGRFHDALDFSRRQVVGAAVGGLVGLCFALVLGSALWVYAVAVLVSITICAAINRSDSGQLAGITATIILLVPHTGSPEDILIARLSEVALGACSATLVVWAARRLRRAWG